LAIVLTLLIGLWLLYQFVFQERALEKSIAVLPITNLSNDPEQEHFTDGMVDAILNLLIAR
jgi:hypothetical protein